MTEGTPGPRSRDLVLALEVAALIIAGVLIVAWLTDAIPALWQTIAFAPVVIIGLVAVTILILARALWPRR
jgi:hypothetical protein